MSDQKLIDGTYYKRMFRGHRMDVYDVLELFETRKQVGGDAVGHAIKKLLRLGNGHKDTETDIREAIKSLERALEMIAEDRALKGEK